MQWALALLMMRYVVILCCSQVAHVGRMFVFGHTLPLHARGSGSGAFCF